MSEQGSGRRGWNEPTYDGPTLDRDNLPVSEPPQAAEPFLDPDATMTRAQLNEQLAGRRALPPRDDTDVSPGRPRRAADDVTREAPRKVETPAQPSSKPKPVMPVAPKPKPWLQPGPKAKPEPEPKSGPQAKAEPESGAGDDTQPRKAGERTPVRADGPKPAAVPQRSDADQTVNRDSLTQLPAPEDDTLAGTETTPAWFRSGSQSLAGKQPAPQPSTTRRQAVPNPAPTPPPASGPAPVPTPAAPAAAPTPKPAADSVPAPLPQSLTQQDQADWAVRWNKTAAGPASETPAPSARTAKTEKGPRRSAGAADEAGAKRKSFGFLTELGVVVLGAMLLTIILRTFVFQLFEVPSGSMENTLQVHDKIVAQKIVPFKRGDVIVFKDANKWLDSGEKPDAGPVKKALEWLGLMPDTSQDYLTKRVIGMPGDRISCCDQQGRLSVNGKPLDETAYLYSDATGMAKPAEKPFEVIVPAGHVWVMGDHRNASGDSRCHLADVSLRGGPAGSGAFIPVDAVVGSVPLILSPTSRFQRLATPDSYADVPEPKEPAPTEGKVLKGDGC